MPKKKQSPSQPESPTPPGPQTSARKCSKCLWWVLALVLILLGLVGVGYLVLYGLQEKYADDGDHFKYGSIGSDNLHGGFPYRILQVLPEMFPEHLPKNGRASWEAFGLITEKDKDRPIGFSKRWHLGIGDVLGPNCAFCHVSTLRQASGGEQKIILGMPGNTVNVEAFLRFLFAAAADERFTVDNVMKHIERQRPLRWNERLVHRCLLIPTFQEGILNLKHKYSFLDRMPTHWGPGRVETWAIYKVLKLQQRFRLLELLPEPGFPWIHTDAGPATGLSDFPALWPLKVDGKNLHWDGNLDDPEERNIIAALGAGATPAALDLESIQRIGRWIGGQLKPESYRDSSPQDKPQLAIKPDLLARGEQIYSQVRGGYACADCHARDGKRIVEVERIDDIKTDHHRLEAFTEELKDKLNTIGDRSRWQLRHFKKTQGYANMLLDRVWLRAPYLHNGSVPTLRDLLKKPEDRPKMFYRGNDVYDWSNVGFKSDVAEEQGRKFFEYDTTLRGNGNGGHEYGTDLKDDEKGALIEYLKTL